MSTRSVRVCIPAAAAATRQGFFRFALCGLGNVVPPDAHFSFLWPDPGAAGRAALLFLAACKRGDISIGRDVSRLIARAVWSSRYEMRHPLNAVADGSSSQWVVLAHGGGDLSHEQFLAALPLDTCAYVLVRLDPPETRRLMFVLWMPHTAFLKHKMVHAAAKFSVLRQVGAVDLEVHASEPAELSLDELRGR